MSERGRLRPPLVVWATTRCGGAARAARGARRGPIPNARTSPPHEAVLLVRGVPSSQKSSFQSSGGVATRPIHIGNPGASRSCQSGGAIAAVAAHVAARATPARRRRYGYRSAQVCGVAPPREVSINRGPVGEVRGDSERQERVRNARVAPVEDPCASVAHEDLTVVQVVMVDRLWEAERFQLGTQLVDHSRVAAQARIETSGSAASLRSGTTAATS